MKRLLRRVEMTMLQEAVVAIPTQALLQLVVAKATSHSLYLQLLSGLAPMALRK